MKSILQERLKETTVSIKFKKYYVLKLFFSSLLKKGNRVQAVMKFRKIVQFLKIKAKKHKPFHLIFLAINRLRPPFGIRSKKIAAYKVKLPVYISLARAYTYSVRWLRDAAESGTFSTFEENMAQEILAAIRKKGNAYNKRMDMCKDINESRANLRFVKK